MAYLSSRLRIRFSPSMPNSPRESGFMVLNLKHPSHRLVMSTSNVKQTANRLPLGILRATERHLFAYGGLAVGTAVGLQPSSISIASSHNCENIFGLTASSSSLSI